VTNRYGGISFDQQQGYRHAHDIGATKHNGIRAAQLRASFFQENHTTSRRAGDKYGFTTFLRQPPNVDRVEAVHVLGRPDQLGERVRLAGQRRRQGQLQEDAVDGVVLVELADGRPDPVGAAIGRQRHVPGFHAQLFAGFDLLAHVHP